jgi:hypothetical protein
MQDKSFYSSNSDKPQISEGLQEYINAMVEEIVLNGENFEKNKKWLKKYSENEGIDYEEYENSLSDFFEFLSDYKNTKSSAFRRLLGRQAKLCFITEELLNKLLDSGEKEDLAEPVILTFSVEPAKCEAGGEITLTWEVENVTDLYLQELPNLKLNEAYSLKIKNVTANKDFTLVALNKGEKSEKKTQCTVGVLVNKNQKDLNFIK